MISARFRLRRLVNTALNLLYPESDAVCTLCQRPFTEPAGTGVHNDRTIQAEPSAWGHFQTKGVCPFCLQDAKGSFNRLYLRRFDLANGASGPSAEMRVLSSSRYSGIVRTAIRKWKYDGVIDLTMWFRDWIVRAQTAYRSLGNERDSAWLTYDAIVPVPPSPDRFRKRGYDHVGLLAASLAQASHIPVMPVLTRVPTEAGFTQSQTAKTVGERLSSLQNAYCVADGASISGKRLVLLDDIVTSGATMYTCAKALMQAGASQIGGLAVANVE